MPHVMIDLETLGTTPDSAFISLGACVFDPSTGSIGKEFSMNFEWSSACEGRVIDPQTVRWWLTQSKEAQNSLFSLPDHGFVGGLWAFQRWFRDYGGVPWSNGATFDIVMMEHAFRQHDIPCPWKHWDIRDTRTLESLSKVNRKSIVREGVHHSALDDAKYQAKYISIMYQDIFR